MKIASIQHANLFLRVVILGSVLLLALAESHGVVVAGTTIAVNTPSDELNSDGDCSLREAIQAANTDSVVDACPAGSGADTITLPAGTYTLTLGSELTIGSDLSLNGAGATSTIIQAATSPGVASARVINITSGTVALSGVTVRHGKLTDHGAGILNAGTLSVTDSTFSDNDAGTARHGGAIRNDSGATLTVIRSTFSGNSASEGGAIQNRGTATIKNSTFSGNSASNSGGGLDNIGGGNTSTIINTTFTDNTAGSGGGVFNIFGTVTLVNTIVAGNFGSAAREDCFGAGISSLGHNLVGVGTGCPTGGTGDLTTADAKLSLLQDNSGPTFTHALLAGSPAIDVGDDGAAPATDQRGIARPQGPASDIGAFELEVVSPTPTPTPIPVPGVTGVGMLLMAGLFLTVFFWAGKSRRRQGNLPK